MNIFQEMTRTKRKFFGPKRPITESPHLVEDFREFKDWYDRFLRVNVAYEIYKPPHLPTWFDAVQDAHLEIRRHIDGMSITGKYELNDVQRPAEFSDCKPIIAVIENLLPMYLNDFYLGRHDLLLPNISRYRGVKTGKHITEYADKIQLDPDKRKQLNKALSDLGNEWAKCRVKRETVFTTLSTEAKAFMLLGHYGADDGSCFRQGGAKNSNKYNLAECENTFVFLVHKDSNTGVESSSQNSARAWGFFNIKERVVNFSNLYVGKYFSQGNAIELMRLQAASLLNANPDEVKVAKSLVDRTPGVSIHLNHGEDTSSFYVGDKEPDTQRLTMSI